MIQYLLTVLKVDLSVASLVIEVELIVLSTRK